MGLCVTQARAAIVIDVEDVWVPPGAGTAYVGVFASSNASDAITGFNFPIDVGNDGNIFPSGFTLNGTPIQNVIPGYGAVMTFNTTQNVSFNIDGIVNIGFATNVTLTSTPVRLFDIVVNYGPAVLGGTSVPVIVDSNTANNGGPPVNQFRLDTTPTSAGLSATVLAGSINAIPEPGVLIPILATILSGGAMYFTRRRRS